MRSLPVVVLACLFGAPLSAQVEDAERFLVPLYVDQPIYGAFGSQWVTEVSVANESDEPVFIYGWNQLCPIICTPEPAPPHVAFYPLLTFWATGVQGIYLRIPRDDVDNVSIHLRIRDLSRPEIAWGTEIPVVHESRARAVVRLLDIPTDSRYRQLLRVYDFAPSEGADAIVRLYAVNPDTRNPVYGNVPPPDPLILETRMPFRLPFGGNGTNGHPGYAELFLPSIVDLTGFARGRLVVESTAPASRLWAFVSISNNETQQVSIISPE